MAPQPAAAAIIARARKGSHQREVGGGRVPTSELASWGPGDGGEERLSFSTVPGTLHSHLLCFVSHAVAASSRNCSSLVFLLSAFGGDWKFKRTNEKGPGKSLHKAPLWLPPFPSSCLRTVRGMRNQLPVLTPARLLSPFPRFTNPRIIQLKKNSERKLAEEGGGGRFLAVKYVCVHVCVCARVCVQEAEGRRGEELGNGAGAEGRKRASLS